ncbi:hypothetical protein JCM3766R1_002851 [Sporobolomyces carnicolor]
MTTSRPPRSRSSVFIPPGRVSSTSSSKTTLLSKIGALRRVSSFSSLSPARSSSPPSTPTAPSSPSTSEIDAYETLPQDIPRSSSVMSWFSSDEETDSSRKPWRMPRLRRKTRTSPRNPTFTFTTTPSALSSPETEADSGLGAPLHLVSTEAMLLPAVHPIELDLALDFDCAFPRPHDSEDSGPPSPPFTPAFYPMSRYLESPPVFLKHPCDSVCWYDNQPDEEEDTRTVYAPSSSSGTSPGLSSPWSSTSRNSPEMTEEDTGDFEDDPTFGIFEEDEKGARAADELDEDVCRQLAAFRILPTPPDLVAIPRNQSRQLRNSSSEESLLDPYFESPSTPSPTTLYSPAFSSSPRFVRERSKTIEFSFPLPPSDCERRQVSFLGVEIDEDDDSPWFDCDP